MKVSLLKNAKQHTPIDYISFSQLVDLIRDKKLEKRTKKYRELVDEAGKDNVTVKGFKIDFQAFSACELTYCKSDPKNIIEYDGYIIIDVDDVDPQKLEKLKLSLAKEPDVVLYYISVSGRGLKVVHHTVYSQGDDITHHHRNAFENYNKSYQNKYDIQIDDKCKDYVRMSFISYDPNAYYNAESYPVAMNQLIERRTEMSLSTISKATNGDTELIIADIYDYLKKHHLTIGDKYDDWLALCFALKHELSDQKAREWFHLLSMLNPAKYNKQVATEKLDSIKIDRDKTYTMGTIIYLAQQIGYKLSPKLKSMFGFDLKEQTVRYTLQQCGIELRFNLIEDELEIRENENEWKRITNRDLNRLYLKVLNEMFDKNKAHDVLGLVSPDYDPIDVFVAGLPDYDGSQCIRSLARTLTCSCDDTLVELMVRKWLVGFMAMLANPTVVNENILVLQGGQGIGKTRFFRKLSEPFKKYFVAKNINPSDKDDKFLTSGNFLILFDEMENMISTKANTEAFKALMSEMEFKARRPYGRVSNSYRRISSFAGTINKTTFIKDITGSRRFFVLPCSKIDYEHTVDMNMVFAEALSLYNSGYKYYLSPAEQTSLSQHNETFKEELLEQELLNKWIEPATTKYGMSATEVFQAINTRENNVLSCKVSFIGRLLNAMGYEKNSRNLDGNKAYPIQMCHTVSQKSIGTAVDLAKSGIIF